MLNKRPGQSLIFGEIPTILWKYIPDTTKEKVRQEIREFYKSNPLSIFLKLCCHREESLYASYSEIYNAYNHYLYVNKKRRVRMKELKSILNDEGYWVEKETKYSKGKPAKSGYWINGIVLKPDWKMLSETKKEDLQKTLEKIGGD